MRKTGRDELTYLRKVLNWSESALGCLVLVLKKYELFQTVDTTKNVQKLVQSGEKLGLTKDMWKNLANCSPQFFEAHHESILDGSISLKSLLVESKKEDQMIKAKACLVAEAGFDNYNSLLQGFPGKICDKDVEQFLGAKTEGKNQNVQGALLKSFVKKLKDPKCGGDFMTVELEHIMEINRRILEHYETLVVQVLEKDEEDIEKIITFLAASPKTQYAVLLIFESDKAYRSALGKLNALEKESKVQVQQIFFSRTPGKIQPDGSFMNNLDLAVIFGKFSITKPPLKRLNFGLEKSLLQVISAISHPEADVAYVSTGSIIPVSLMNDEDSRLKLTYFAPKKVLERFKRTKSDLQLMSVVSSTEAIADKTREGKACTDVKGLSSVFDYEDDPEVVEIRRRNKEEAEKLAARAQIAGEGKRRESMEKMAKFIVEGKIPKLKKPSPAKSGGSEHKKVGSSVNRRISLKKEDSIKLPGYMPSLEELLRLPDRPDDGGKTMEEVLDDMDLEIAERRKKHEIEMTCVDISIATEKMKQEETEERYLQNGERAERLREEVTELELRKFFKDNLQYLKDIQSGIIDSSRHTAYRKSARSRHALYYTMLTDPLSDEQLDVALEELSKVWMRTSKEQMDNNDYIWKVLLAEFIIKVYMDKFDMDKNQAEQCISETPLPYEDSGDSDNGVEDIGDECVEKGEEESFDESLYS